MKKAVNVILVVVLLVIIIKACGPSSSDSSYTPPAVASTQASADTSAIRTQAAQESALISNWEYSQEQDDMTEKVSSVALCKSTNLLDFKFPYDGGSSLTIELRGKKGKNEVILEISKGQFLSPYDSQVNIRFDDGPVSKYGFSDAADGSSNYIFLNAASQIIQRLKKAKHVKIQAPFYQEGIQVAFFDVAGLEWKY